ncbi:MAG: hypothetical protein ACREB5_05135 [Sphingomonadaceae bacterium]
MGNINWGRFLATCAVVTIIIFVLDIVFHAWIVPGMYAGYPQRPQAEIAGLIPFLFLTYIVQITLFCLMYLFIYPRRGMASAVFWALWGGFFVVIPNMQFFVGVAGTTWALLLVQVVEAIVLLVLGMIVFELAYRPRTSQSASKS